jgi:hypothetical protein
VGATEYTTMDKTLLLSVLLCVVLVVCVQEGSATRSENYISQFNGYKVIRANITSQKEIKMIVKRNMDVWSGDSWAVIGLNDIMVSPQDMSEFVHPHKIDYDVIVDDVASSLQRELDENNAARSASADWFESFHNYDEIVTFSSELARTYPHLLSYEAAIGKSLEGRNIPLLAITGGRNTTKSKLMLLGGQHAREWIGPATVLYIANKLVTGYGIEPKITALVDNFDFVIIPTLNPDGYVWTWTNYRLWRKNRRPNTGGSFGVDLNRNWANHWCENGASRTPSSDTYCGTGPFSEPETKTIETATTKYAPFGGAIDFHSYGQLIMRPYGWSTTPPDNNAHLAQVGDGMVSVMREATGVAYTNQAIWELYLSSGSSCDWFHDESKIPLSFGFEARDTGRYGFELPPDQIVPSGEENFAAVAYLASEIKNSK